MYRQCQFLLTIVRFQLGLMVFHVRVGGAVKDTLEGAMGLLLTPVQWSQASLPTTNVTSGGVGLRMTSKHSVAAYMKLNESHG